MNRFQRYCIQLIRCQKFRATQFRRVDIVHSAWWSTPSISMWSWIKYRVVSSLLSLPAATQQCNVLGRLLAFRDAWRSIRLIRALVYKVDFEMDTYRLRLPCYSFFGRLDRYTCCCHACCKLKPTDLHPSYDRIFVGRSAFGRTSYRTRLSILFLAPGSCLLFGSLMHMLF